MHLAHALRCSHQAAFGKRQRPSAPHDQVVKDANVNELQAAFERLGEQLVGARGLQQAGRVVVRQDQAGGIELQRALDDLTGVNAGDFNLKHSSPSVDSSTTAAS